MGRIRNWRREKRPSSSQRSQFGGRKLKFIFFLCCFFTANLCANTKYYLSICAIFRNEARFLKEWIEYHQMVGVDHFYLFNNLSEDGYLETLQPYIEKGIVDLFEWPHIPNEHKNWTKVQCGAYNTLIRLRGKETFWLAVIDIDEFIVPVKEQNLKDFLKEYEPYGGLGINWQIYGCSGIYHLPTNQTQIGTLTKKAIEEHDRNRFVKTICQPKKIKEIKKPHHCIYKDGYFHVTENKTPFEENKSLTGFVSVNKIRINHYTYHDEDFFYNEKRRRVQEWFPKAPPIEMETDYNDVEDPIMKRYVQELESKLFF